LFGLCGDGPFAAHLGAVHDAAVNAGMGVAVMHDAAV
jgi:hypothetical protein